PSRVSPDYPHHLIQRAVLTTPAKTAGRRSHLDFRGLLKLHSRYGPLACSAAQGGLCHEASIPPVAQENRPSATRAIDNSLRGTFLHWRCAPSGRTLYEDTLLNPANSCR